MIGGEERPAASGETHPEVRAGHRRAAHARRALGQGGRRRRDHRGRRPRSPPGRARRPPTAARCCAGSPSCSSATRTRSPRSSPPRPASRPRTRSARSAARSRWATSWPARAAACTARRRRPRCPNRQAMIVRQPLGVAGLIIAANTPIANVAWKVFPALVCGNAVVLKASEDTPETALAFARLAAEAGLPAGVLNVVQGLGPEAGQPIVEDPRVAVVSFTGSTAVGRMIARVAGERLAKVCLELGGKNPFVVCDDADLEAAATAAALSRLLQRRPALRRGQPDHRLRRRLRRVQGAAAGAHARAARRPDRRPRLRPGDQPAPARQHARQGPRGQGRGRDDPRRRRPARRATATTWRRR